MPSKSKSRNRIVCLTGVTSEKRALQCELLSWGINAPTNNQEHVDFTARLTVAVQLYQNVAPNCPAKPVDLPKHDVEEAVRIIFRDSITTCPKLVEAVVDKLKEGDYGPCRNVYLIPDKKNMVKVHLKNHFSIGDIIDPVRRFVHVGTLKGQERFRNLVNNLNSDEIKGHGYEAIVAWHASHNEACYHCKSRNSLRWAGGGNSPWTDMVCTYCDSAYEIKSKAGTESVKKASYSINGGSYRRYYELHNDKSRKVGWQHFVVLLSRTTSNHYDMEQRSYYSTWQVQIGKIHKIKPRLSPRSFVLGDPMRLQSTIQLCLQSKLKAWFNIPRRHYIDFGALYKSVLVEEFYPGLAVVNTSEEHAATAAETTPNTGSDDDVQKAPHELVLDDPSVDNWEERDSDTDE